MADHVIWQTQPGDQTDFEKEYLCKVVLADCDSLATTVDGSFSVPANDAVVVFSWNKSRVHRQMKDYLAANPGVSLIHLSGETLPDSDWLYENCRVVLRSYYDPTVRKTDVYALPLGFKSGVMAEAARQDKIVERDLVWFFVGELKNDRAEMLRAFAALEPNTSLLTTRWNSPSGMSVEQMCLGLRRANFALCPFGWTNPDSFRVMEALECGAIPVSIRFRGHDYFRYIFGDHPFVVATDWSQAAEIVNALMRSPDEITSRLKTVEDWYAGFKQRLASDVRAILSGENRKLVSEQFHYQAAGRRALMLKWTYDWHFKLAPWLRSGWSKLRARARGTPSHKPRP